MLKPALGIALAVLISAGPQPLTIPEEISNEFEFLEPSAAVYLPDLDSFLVASDDTNEADEPFLFLMNRAGEISKEPFALTGLKKMTDMESMSLGADGNLYVLSSLGLNKNGKEKPERNWFVRASRTAKKIEITDKIQLRSLLLEALEDLELPD